MRQSAFIANSSVPSALIRAVSRQIGGWESFIQAAGDINNYGANTGWSGFIWTDENSRFYRLNRKAILQLAETEASEMGTDMLTMIASFNCLRDEQLTANEVAKALYLSEGEMADQIQNAMAWFALEECARSYCDYVEWSAV
jgi:hypothetical protein